MRLQLRELKELGAIKLRCHIIEGKLTSNCFVFELLMISLLVFVHLIKLHLSKLDSLLCAYEQISYNKKFSEFKNVF